MSEAATNKKTPIYKVLYFQVICAIVIGIVLGAVWPEVGEKMKPFGDGFIRLIKMIIAPVIFCTVVTGIAGMENIVIIIQIKVNFNQNSSFDQKLLFFE